MRGRKKWGVRMSFVFLGAGTLEVLEGNKSWVYFLLDP